MDTVCYGKRMLCSVMIVNRCVDTELNRCMEAVCYEKRMLCYMIIVSK